MTGICEFLHWNSIASFSFVLLPVVRSRGRGSGSGAAGAAAAAGVPRSRPGRCSLHGHGRGAPGARAGWLWSRAGPSRAGGGAARGAQPDKEQSRQPNKEVGAGGFQNRSRGGDAREAGEAVCVQGAALCCYPRSAECRGSRLADCPYPSVILSQQS